MPAPAGDALLVVSVIPCPSKKCTSKESSRSLRSDRRSCQRPASTVVDVSSDWMTIRSSDRVDRRTVARRLIAALRVWAPGWKR